MSTFLQSAIVATLLTMPSFVLAQVPTAGCQAALNTGAVRPAGAAVHLGPDIQLDCQGTGLECLPGYNNLGQGFDAIYSTPLDVIQTKGLVPSPLPQLVAVSWPSSTDCTGCTFTTSANTYLVPTGVTVDDTLPGSQGDILSSNSYTSYAEYYQSKSLAASIGVNSPWVSGSSALNDVRTSLDCEGKAVTSTIERVLVYNATLSANQPLAPSFQSDLTGLPEAYDEASYVAFVKQYGTHYYSSLWLGGVLAVELDIDASYAQGQSSTTLEAQAQAQYFSVSGSSRVSTSDRTMSADFKNSYSERHMTLGGEISLPFSGNDDGEKEAQYDQWVSQVRQDPVVARASVSPIWEIIPDDVLSEYAYLTDNLEQGVNDYIAQEIAALGILPSAPTTAPHWAGEGEYLFCGEAGGEHIYAYSCVAQLTDTGVQVEGPLSPIVRVPGSGNRNCWGNQMKLARCPTTTVTVQPGVTADLTVTAMRLYRMDTGPQYVGDGPTTPAQIEACFEKYGTYCWVGDPLGP